MNTSYSRQIAMPSKLLTPATDGQEKAVGKRAEGLQSSWVDTWPCSASNGGRLASNGVGVAHEGTDEESPSGVPS